MQPLPWSDPSLRFTSAPVFDNEQATEELQTTSASVNADSTDIEAIEAQQEAEVWAALVYIPNAQMECCMLTSVCCVDSVHFCCKRA